MDRLDSDHITAGMVTNLHKNSQNVIQHVFAQKPRSPKFGIEVCLTYIINCDHLFGNYFMDFDYVGLKSGQFPVKKRSSHKHGAGTNSEPVMSRKRL